MAVAEINLKAITRQKNVLDTVGHYSRPDILRLLIDRSPHPVVEEMTRHFDEISEIGPEAGDEDTARNRGLPCNISKPYLFHRKDAEDAEKSLFSFAVERTVNEKCLICSYNFKISFSLPASLLCHSQCGVRSAEGKKNLCILCDSAVNRYRSY